MTNEDVIALAEQNGKFTFTEEGEATYNNLTADDLYVLAAELKRRNGEPSGLIESINHALVVEMLKQHGGVLVITKDHIERLHGLDVTYKYDKEGKFHTLTFFKRSDVPYALTEDDDIDHDEWEEYGYDDDEEEDEDEP